MHLPTYLALHDWYQCHTTSTFAPHLFYNPGQICHRSKLCTMCTPSRPPAPPAHFTQRRSTRKAGPDHQARWKGARGGEGSKLEVLEWREEDVHMGRRWQTWRRLGERERRWPALGVEDAYGRRGEWEARWGSLGEADVDMGRLWHAWRRPGDQERRLQRLGVEDAYGRREEREARWDSWGEADVDMGRQCGAWWRLGERERRERGPGALWWRLGERERRE